MNDLATTTIDLSKILDRPKLSGFQKLILCLCALVIVLDGFDAQAMGYVAPALIKTFNVPRSELGPVFSAGLFGRFIGSLVISPVADRLGRKIAVLGAVVLFSVCSLMTATAGTLNEVLIWRFITGLGLGGAIPTTLTVVSDLRRGGCVARSRCWLRWPTPSARRWVRFFPARSSRCSDGRRCFWSGACCR
jgi:MFS transporter, AAHS family, 4-hydroxybenzoate transporter